MGAAAVRRAGRGGVAMEPWEEIDRYRMLWLREAMRRGDDLDMVIERHREFCRLLGIEDPSDKTQAVEVAPSCN